MVSFFHKLETKINYSWIWFHFYTSLKWRFKSNECKLINDHNSSFMWETHHMKERRDKISHDINIVTAKDYIKI